MSFAELQGGFSEVIAMFLSLDHWQLFVTPLAGMLEVLRWGYQIPFRSAPPLSKEPIPFSTYAPSSIRGKALEREVLSLVEKGAVKLVPLPSPGFYSHVFVVMKASGSWRPIIDLSTLNLRAVKSPFKMETLQSVLLSVRRGDWMVSLDVQVAYLQVPVHPDSHKFLRFMALAGFFSSRPCASVSPRPCRFLRGSWLWCQPSFTSQVSGSTGTSTTALPRPCRGSWFFRL